MTMETKKPKNWLPVALALSLCLNLFLFLLYLNTSQPLVFTVPGTYCSTTGSGPNMILLEDGRYCRYLPFTGIQEVGTYILRGGNQVCFLAEDREYCVPLLEGSLYIYEQGNVLKLDKTTDVPYYNGVPDVLTDPEILAGAEHVDQVPATVNDD